MATPRRKCRLADIDFRDEDLRKYKKVIIDTINKTVPNKNPRVFADYFSTDILTQSESVMLGRALSKIPELKQVGKTVMTFRLFDGKNYDSESSPIPSRRKKAKTQENKPKGGRMK